MSYLAEKVGGYMLHKKIISSEDLDIYCYGFECLFSSCLQIITILAASVYLGKVYEELIFFTAFSVLKRWIGGWHADSHIKCFFVTTALAVFGCCAPSCIPEGLQAKLILILCTASCTAVFIWAPIMHPHRRRTSSQLKNCRKWSCVTAVFSSLVIIFGKVLLPGCITVWLSGALGLFAAALTLLIPVERRMFSHDNLQK